MARSARSVGAIIGLCAFGLYAYHFGRDFLMHDPLRRFAMKQAEDRREATIFINDADFCQYDGANLVAIANVGQIKVSRDRQVVWLEDIKNGKYFASKDRSFEFSAEEGMLNQSSKTLSGNKKVRVWNQDLDLDTDTMSYSQRTCQLAIPNYVQGALFGGHVRADNIIYNVSSRIMEAGPVLWVGQLKGEIPVESAPSKPKAGRWTISAEKVKGLDENRFTYTKATATDGEVIVKADKVDFNRKSDVLVGTGNVRYFSSDANVACDKVTVYRKERKAVLESGVTMLVKPEKDKGLPVTESQFEPLRPVVPESIAASRPSAPLSDEDRRLDRALHDPATRRDYPISILAQKIEYWYKKGSRKAVVTGAPQARQELPGGRWRQIWAFRGLYDGEKDRLKLESGADQKTRLKSSLGDDLTADWFEVSTKEGQSDFEASGVLGDFVQEEQQEE